MLIADTVRGYVAVDGYEDISGVMDRDREVHARARPMRLQRTKTSPEVQSARDADPGDQGYAGLHGELAPRGRRRRRVDRDHRAPVFARACRGRDLQVKWLLHFSFGRQGEMFVAKGKPQADPGRRLICLGGSDAAAGCLSAAYVSTSTGWSAKLMITAASSTLEPADTA